MPVYITWQDIFLRLGLTTVAGMLIGINRQHGHSAGLRTTMLVALAAAAAMIQANLLMPTVGKTGNSFVVLDLMRLPLGILSGMGFIGAGAILRKGDMVRGLTTAATLWFVTVIGLCFGGGQNGLGIASTCLAVIVLWLFKYVEYVLPQPVRGRLAISIQTGALDPQQVQSLLKSDGFEIVSMSVAYAKAGAQQHLELKLLSHRKRAVSTPPRFLDELAKRPGVSRLRWQPAPMDPTAQRMDLASALGKG